ncbi:hypothetical protein GCM10011504_04140 [Siccirubricoccus deserti]|nr:hypothetical protein GCM10011504_04140 [Siccirubricoccus deserti]
MSPTRAAGMPPISTVIDPSKTIPGPPGTQAARVQGAVVLVTVAAGWPPISTVGTPTMIASGIGGCGTGVGTGAGGWIGAWQCGASCRTMSPNRAAGGILGSLKPERFAKGHGRPGA